MIYEDNHLLVAFKPPGMLSQSDETGDVDLLTLSKQWLKQRYQKPGKVFLGLVHRLDRPASGLMVFARTSKAAARLSTQFRDRLVEKRYWAVVQGTLRGSGSMEDYLIKNGRLSSVVPAHVPRAKRAVLQWEALEHQAETTLVDIRLQTGRAHQIRCQFASRNHPLVGDLRYGAERVWDGRNLALHAWLLALDHPTRKERLLWREDAPAAWEEWYPEIRRRACQ